LGPIPGNLVAQEIERRSGEFSAIFVAFDAEALLRLLQRWRDEATKAGRTITRIAVAFETGREASGWRAG
jgi:hypothetical protein